MTLELVFKVAEASHWCTSWWPISGLLWKHCTIVALITFVQIRSSLQFCLGWQVSAVWRMVQHVSDNADNMWLGVVLHEVTSSDCAGPVSTITLCFVGNDRVAKRNWVTCWSCLDVCCNWIAVICSFTSVPLSRPLCCTACCQLLLCHIAACSPTIGHRC